jgi:hypothetical protein
MGSFLQDLRYGVRMLGKNPGFAALAVMTLALGIGANTAIFTVINSVLLRPLPYDEPDRLVMLWERDPRRNIEQQHVAPPNLAEWQEQSRSFEKIAYWSVNVEFNLVTADGRERAMGAHATSDFFATLRVRPQLGRLFVPEEDRLDGNRAALLSYEYWQRRFAADPQVIGRTLTVDRSARQDCTIVGVLQPGFSFPNRTEIWLSAGWDDIPRERRGPWLWVIGRLKPGMSCSVRRSPSFPCLNRRWAVTCASLC